MDIEFYSLISIVSLFLWKNEASQMNFLFMWVCTEVKRRKYDSKWRLGNFNNIRRSKTLKICLQEQ